MTAAARRLAYRFLCAVPILLIVTTVRALRIPGVYHAIAATMVTAVSMAVWTLGGQAIRAKGEERQRIALAGGLLAGAWAALFVVFPGIGPPEQATDGENQLRYLALLVAGVFVMGGFVALKEALAAAGERLYSTLGLAATVLASPLCLLFSAIQLMGYRAAERTSMDLKTADMASLDELSIILLFVGAALTYVAAAAFAAALGRASWLGHTATRIFVGASLFALSWVGIKMLVMVGSPRDPMWAFEKWYAIPGVVFSIPALPLIVPYLIGVATLRRASEST